MRTHHDASKRVRLEGAPAERIELLQKIQEVRAYFHTHEGFHAQGMVRVALIQAWKTIPLDGVALCHLIGRERTVLRRVGLSRKDEHQYGSLRLSGRLDPPDIPRLIAMLKLLKEGKPVPRLSLEQLFKADSKSSPGLLISLLGTTPVRLQRCLFDKQGTHVDCHHLLPPKNRSGYQGRPGQGQGAGPAVHTGPVDDGRRRRPALTELDHAGSVLEYPWPAHTEPGADQDQAELPDDTGQGAHELSEEDAESFADNGEAIIESVNDFDESGDSYLADLPKPPAGVGVAFEEWEQDFD